MTVVNNPPSSRCSLKGELRTSHWQCAHAINKMQAWTPSTICNTKGPLSISPHSIRDRGYQQFKASKLEASLGSIEFCFKTNVTASIIKNYVNLKNNTQDCLNSDAINVSWEAAPLLFSSLGLREEVWSHLCFSWFCFSGVRGQEWAGHSFP